MGRIINIPNDNWYKWRISVYDAKTNTTHTDRYFSIKHFNNVHGTNYNSDHVQKLRKLQEKIGDYTMENVSDASPHSVLGKFGHLKFEKIREPVQYEITKTLIREPCDVSECFEDYKVTTVKTIRTLIK